MYNSYLLKILHIKKIYKNTIYALNGVNLNLRDKIIFGLVGPNGAGKSTLINILSSIILPDEGEIFLEGSKILPTDYLYKRRLGFLLENPIYFEKLTINEQIKFLLNIYDIDNPILINRSKEFLLFLELNNKENRRIETLSSGEKKKVAFLCSLLHDPILLFLDEPFENIDPISRKKMKDVLKRMRDKGNTIFITSHALAEVEDFCDEVAIINKGKIVYQSETKDIRNKIKNEVTKETYQSLEDIFIDLTTDKDENEKTLSWI